MGIEVKTTIWPFRKVHAVMRQVRFDVATMQHGATVVQKGSPVLGQIIHRVGYIGVRINPRLGMPGPDTSAITAAFARAGGSMVPAPPILSFGVP
jgi:hypothetical protein